MKDVKRLEGKVVVITGVAAGIGRASAELFARHGAIVVGADVDEKEGRSLEDTIKKSSGSMTFVRTDVSNVSELEKLFEVAQGLGGVDVLFNNAGIEVSKGIMETTEQDWDTSVNVNLKSVFY